ncbi:Cell division control protein 7 [Savitreella phatthalungensis]
MSWRTRSAIPNHGSSAIKVAERGGTRGYRAPEVLLHCTSQSTAIDIWSVGITLLCFLTQSKVFFNCEDDTDATVELSHIIGTANLKRVAFQHGSHMQINIPTAPVEAVPWIDVIQHEAMERKAHLNGSRFDLRALTASKGTRPRQTVPQASYNSLSRQTNANLMPLQPLPTNVVAQRMHQLNQEKQRQRSEPVAVNNPAVFGLPQRSHTHATAGCLTQQQIIRPLPSRAFVPQSERPRKMTVFRDVEQRPEDELTMTPPTSTTSSIQAQQLPTTAEPTFREIAWPPRSRSPDRPHESKRDVFYLDSTWPFLEPYDAERLNAACEFLSHALEPDYKTRWTADQLLNSDFIQSAGE